MIAPRPAGLADPIPLDDAQRDALAAMKARIDRGHAGYPDAYALVHDWIKDDPRAQVDGRDFWFEQARGINANDSLGASFIRTHTEIGLDETGIRRTERLPMQELSNKIGEQVIRDIARNGEVLSLPEMLARDIEVALTEGKMQLGGWGGSFYYHDQPYVKWNENTKEFEGAKNPDGSVRTIGDEIDHLGQRDLLVETSARTLVRMAERGDFNPTDRAQWEEVGLTAKNAGAPLEVKGAIALRAGELGVERGAEVAEDIARAQADRARDSVIERIAPTVREAVDTAIDAARGAAARAAREAVDTLRERFIDPLDPRASFTPSVPPGFAPPQSQGPDLRDRSHPGHAAFNEMQHRVAMFEANNGIPSGPHSEQLAAALLQKAVENKVSYQNVYFHKDEETGRMQMVERRDRHVSAENSRRFDLDLRGMSSQPVETSSRRLNEALSSHYAEPARMPAVTRSPEKAQALAGLSFEDQVMFGRIRRDLPGHIDDAHVAQAMTAAKREGMTDAASIGGVMMLGDRIRVMGVGEGAPAASVDVTQPAPKIESAVAGVQAVNAQQQAQDLQVAQQQAQGAAMRMA